jgi:hypothetical protein
LVIRRPELLAFWVLTLTTGIASASSSFDLTSPWASRTKRSTSWAFESPALRMIRCPVEEGRQDAEVLVVAERGLGSEGSDRRHDPGDGLGHPDARAPVCGGRQQQGGCGEQQGGSRAAKGG